jgi:hypothetical protein
MNFFNKNNEDENKKRLQNLVIQTKEIDEPNGWRKTVFAIGGLSEIGFSKQTFNICISV